MNCVISNFLNEKVLKNKLVISAIRLQDFNEGVSFLKNEFFSDQFGGYAESYHSSKTLKEDLKKEPLLARSSKKYVGSIEDVWELLESNCISAINIESSILDKAMYDYCIKKEPCLIYFLDKKHQDTKNTVDTIKKEPLLLEFVREDLKTYKLCNLAFSLDKRCIKFIPIELIGHEIKESISNERALYILEYVPYEYWNDTLLGNQIEMNPLAAIEYIVKKHILNGNVEEITTIVKSIVENKENIDLKTIDSITCCDPFFVNFVREFYKINPDILEVLNIETAPKEIHDFMIKVGFLDNMDVEAIPDRVWRDCYGTIYQENNSVLAFKYPEKHQSSILFHKEYWVKRWIKLKKEEHENLPQLPSCLVTKEVIEDADLYGEIYKDRLCAQLLMNGDIDFENLNKISRRNASIDELKQIKASIPSDMIVKLQKENAYWLSIKIADNTITTGEAIRFAKENPVLAKQLPRNILENDDFIEGLESESPKSLSYLLKG